MNFDGFEKSIFIALYKYYEDGKCDRTLLCRIYDVTYNILIFYVFANNV